MSAELIQAITNTYNIPVIQERNYWFVRTLGGDFFPDFITNSYIAIGWDYVNLNDMKFERDPLIVRMKIEINEIQKRTQVDFDLVDIEEPSTKEDEEYNRMIKSKITKIYNKINSFVNEMNEGDIVLIPSYNSDKLVIGVIKSAAYENTEYIEQFIKDNPDSAILPCPYHKRRNVEWIKTYPKEDLDVYLQNAIRSQQALSSLNDYADIINRNIHDIYLSDNKMHSIIRTEQYADFSLADLKSLIDFIYESYTILGQYPDASFANDIKIKINVHSPLLLEIIIASGMFGVVVPPLIAIYAAYQISKYGGKVELGKFKWETNGSLTPEVEMERIRMQKRQMELVHKLLSDPQFQDKAGAINRMGVIMPDIDSETLP